MRFTRTAFAAALIASFGSAAFAQGTAPAAAQPGQRPAQVAPAQGAQAAPTTVTPRPAERRHNEAPAVQQPAQPRR